MCTIVHLLREAKIFDISNLTLNKPEVDKFAHPFFLSQKISLATYDQTLCKFLFYTYEDSRNLIWSKKLSRGHVEDINRAWVENCNNKNCIFRVLRGILEGFFLMK